MKISDDEVNMLTINLISEGRLIEAGFVAMMALSWPGAGVLQTQELRMAFFAGAHHTFASTILSLDAGEEPTAADMGRMSKIQEELDRFIKGYAAAHLPTQGSA